jgi:hypothetical protein
VARFRPPADRRMHTSDDVIEIRNEGNDAVLNLKIEGLDADHVAINIDDGVVTVRLRGANPGTATPPTTADLVPVVTALAATQLRLLAEIDSVPVQAKPSRVQLETPVGTIDYQLPISVNDTYGPAQVSELLSPSGRGHRSIAQNRRQSNKLLALPMDGQQYRFPKFQIDEAHRTIKPVVAYANQLLECNEDPWGTLDWWFSEDEGLDDRRPVDMLESGELTEELVDFTVELSRQAMD